MYKNLSSNNTPEKSTSMLKIASKANCPKAVCTARRAIQLLDKLRKSYQGLAREERKQVKAFITELSYTAITDSQVYPLRERA